MNTVSLGNVLKAALLAGLAAALAAAAFHSLVTEPVIDQAIAIEEQRSAAGDPPGAPVVSRDMQRIGLWIGFLMYGFSWALLFGTLYYLAQRWLPGSDASKQGLALALLGYWAIGLMPFLKYPANPPGVGDPVTIGYRQTLYFGLLAITLIGAGLTVALNRRFSRSANRLRGRWLTLVFLVVFSAVVYFAMPGNSDPVQMPMSLVTNFRVLSLMGVTLFWSVLGLGFARFVRSSTAGQA
ncbi:MAG: CbtA family protein [Verrucomicrobia subdivision 3 bacterium]|nr:CbtA family protein [Limisphaerales bacterium]